MSGLFCSPLTIQQVSSVAISSNGKRSSTIISNNATTQPAKIATNMKIVASSRSIALICAPVQPGTHSLHGRLRYGRASGRRLNPKPPSTYRLARGLHGLARGRQRDGCAPGSRLGFRACQLSIVCPGELPLLRASASRRHAERSRANRADHTGIIKRTGCTADCLGRFLASKRRRSRWTRDVSQSSLLLGEGFCYAQAIRTF